MKISYLALTLLVASAPAFADSNVPKDLHCTVKQATWNRTTGDRTPEANLLPDFVVKFGVSPSAPGAILAMWKGVEVTANGQTLFPHFSVVVRPNSAINTINAEILDEAAGISSNAFATAVSGNDLSKMPVTFSVSVNVPVEGAEAPTSMNASMFCTNQ